MARRNRVKRKIIRVGAADDGMAALVVHRNKFHADYHAEPVIVRGEVETKDDQGNKTAVHMIRSSLDIMLSRGSINDELYAAGKHFERDFAIASLEHFSNADPTRVHSGGDGQAAPSEHIVIKRRKVMDIIKDLGGEKSVRGSLAYCVLGQGQTLKYWASAVALSHLGDKVEGTVARGIMIAVLDHLRIIYRPRRRGVNNFDLYD